MIFYVLFIFYYWLIVEMPLGTGIPPQNKALANASHGREFELGKP